MAKCSNVVTINDVAKAAGVSKGTVDRVIHNRGEVSPKSREAVLKVIEELGYKPLYHFSMDKFSLLYPQVVTTKVSINFYHQKKRKRRRKQKVKKEKKVSHM